MGLRQYQTPIPRVEMKLVGEKYHIKSHKVSDEYLDVYVVADTHGACFEAQAFAPVGEMPREREGLRQARRRRMRRICRSPNFAEEFEHDGRRFLVSRVQRSVKEWTDLQGLGRSARGGREPEPPSAALCRDHECPDTVAERSEQQQRRQPSYAEAVVRNHECSGGMSTPTKRRRLCLILGAPRGI